MATNPWQKWLFLRRDLSGHEAGQLELRGSRRAVMAVPCHKPAENQRRYGSGSCLHSRRGTVFLGSRGLDRLQPQVARGCADAHRFLLVFQQRHQIRLQGAIVSQDDRMDRSRPLFALYKSRTFRSCGP